MKVLSRSLFFILVIGTGVSLIYFDGRPQFGPAADVILSTSPSRIGVLEIAPVSALRLDSDRILAFPKFEVVETSALIEGKSPRFFGVADVGSQGPIAFKAAYADGEWEVINLYQLGEYIIPRNEHSEELIGLLQDYSGLPVKVLRENAISLLLHIPFESIDDYSRFDAELSGSPWSESGIMANELVMPAARPNDPLFAESWTLPILDLELVWEEFGLTPIQEGSRRPVIAVIDNGAPASNDFHLWTNSAEIPDNGLDDDQNNQVDDVHGYNFVRKNADLSFAGGHGSTVARIAASITHNGIGSASPASSADLMRVLYYESVPGSHFDAIDAMLYAVANGADVVNASFVSSSPRMFDVVISFARENNCVVVVAAGDNGKDIGLKRLYPASLEAPNLLTVGSSTKDDLPGNSNFGASVVDLFAPGSATSFSTPLVTSTVALLRALKPEASSEEIVWAINQGVDPVAEMRTLCRSGGRLNAYGAAQALFSREFPGIESADPPVPVPSVRVLPFDAFSVQLEWQISEEVDGIEVEVAKSGGPFLPLGPQSTFAAETGFTIIDDVGPGTEVAFRVRSSRGDAVSAWALSESFLQAELPSMPEPVLHWSFEEIREPSNGELVTLPNAWPLPGIDLVPLDGQPVETALAFRGDHTGLGIPDSPLLNMAEQAALSISLWVFVLPEMSALTSVLFEQGGYWRGLNLIMDQGWLTANGWNRPHWESGWDGTALNGGKLAVNEWHHVMLVLDGWPEIREDAFRLFVNGRLRDSGPGSQLWEQFDYSGLGQVHGGTVFRGREVRRLDPFQGLIDDLQIWRHVLSESEIQSLGGSHDPG
jgi:hypothetical protein